MYPADGSDAESVLEVADQKMYEAKAESKNRRSSAALARGLARTGSREESLPLETVSSDQ
jgi:hypothetical protein